MSKNRENILVLLILCISTVKLLSLSETKCLDSDDLIIETKSGRVRGACSIVSLVEENEALTTANVYSWQSIPYAEPPTKQLRFKAPQPVKAWKPNILDGTKTPNSCMQFMSKNSSLSRDFEAAGTQISEDCLYLNVYTPSKAYKKADKVPVLVFIHGGSGTSGSSMRGIYNPSALVSFSDFIVITLNYRLDVFGFLHLKDSDNEGVDGNQALLDQHLALKWISENVDRFGGDSSRVTLMGQSAGAVFIGYHLMYKPSWPLFRNVILLSGSPVSIGRNVLSSQGSTSRARFFLSDIGCTAKKLVECARNMDAKNLTVFSKIFFEKKMVGNHTFASDHLKSAFVPTIDNIFFR